MFMIIVNINKDENKSFISNQFKDDLWSFLTFYLLPPQNSSPRNGGEKNLRENWFEMSDLFSSLLIFTIIKTILSTFFLSVAGTTTLDREW
jgi:hypothetical protein